MVYLQNLFEDIDKFFDNDNDNVIPITQSVQNSDIDALTHEEILNQPIIQSMSEDLKLRLFYKKLQVLGFNLDELEDLINTTEDMLVLAGAGSGKTTALILKIIRDYLAGDTVKVISTPSGLIKVPAKILVSTFLKSGADDLKKSFHTWCDKLKVQGFDASTLTFKTIHAEVYDALKCMGVKVQILENTDALLRKVMSMFKIKSLLSNSKRVTNDEVSDFSCIVAYARNRLDNKKYEHPLMEEFNMDAFMLDAVLIECKRLRRASGKMDFEDMQEMLLEGIEINPAVKQYVESRYDFIYVDEFQDTSQLQYKLLRYYFDAAKRKIAIGDDDQTIYSWRGSDSAIINYKFEEDYKPVIRQLTMNYRCAKNILDAVIPSIEQNTGRHEKKLRGCRPNGDLLVIDSGDVNHLLGSVKRDLAEGMDVAILARTNLDLLIPAILLEIEGGLDFQLSKTVSLSNRIPRQVFGLMDLVTKRFTEGFEETLKMFVPVYNHYEVEKLDGILRANKSKSIFNIDKEDIYYSIPTLAPMLINLRIAKEVSDVNAYIFLLDMMIKNVYVGKTVYAQKARDFVLFIKRLILDHEKLKDLSMFELDILFNSELPSRFNIRTNLKAVTRVKLTTVHDAKGKEWDSVAIWNNTKGSFPNTVGSRDLTPEEYEEERRVHYIAWTRCRKKLVVYTEAGRKGDFLLECNLDNAVHEEMEVPKNIVYKKTKKSVIGFDDSIDTYIRTYIVEKSNSGDFLDPIVSNMNLVLSAMGLDDTIQDIINTTSIGIMPTNKEKESVLYDYFESRAISLYDI